MKNVIYQIRNLVNGKRYIGSAAYFNNRKSKHVCNLAKGVHENEYLQRSYDKYGEGNFVFEIIDHVRYAIELLDREYYWFGKYNFDKELYNIDPIPGSRMGRPHTTKSRRKMSKNCSTKKQVAQIDRNTDEILAIFDSGHEANRVTGIDYRNISSVCNGTRETTGGYKWRFATDNNKVDEKYKDKLFKKLPRSRPIVQIDPETQEVLAIFSSLAEAERVTETNLAKAYCVCNGKRKTAGGYIWKYAESNHIVPDKYKDKTFKVVTKEKKGVAQIDPETNKVINVFERVCDGAKVVNTDPSSISKACRDKLKTTGGFKWAYVSLS